MPDMSGRKLRALESLVVGAFGRRLRKCIGDVGDVAAVTAEALFLDGDAGVETTTTGYGSALVMLVMWRQSLLKHSSWTVTLKFTETTMAT